MPPPKGPPRAPARPARRPAEPASDPAAGAERPTAERIAKVMARAGVASRRDAEEMVRAGRVAVNGRRIDTPATTVTAADRITLDGAPLPEPERARLWLYHKPPGLVTTARDEHGRPTVLDNLPPGLPRVMTVGRLDLNSEGLLLLTNDGELKRKLELPATGWLRRYRARVHGTPTEAQLAPLKDGITLEGERFQPMSLTIDRQQGANAWLTIGLREGRNREIRRALEAVGLTVNRLIRISYGPFQLGDLAPGSVEEVRGRVLRDQLGADPDAGRAVAAPERGAPRPAPGPDAKPAPRSWGMRSHWGAARPPRPADPEAPQPAAARPGPKSWGSRSHAGVVTPRKPAAPARPAGPPGKPGRGPTGGPTGGPPRPGRPPRPKG